MGFEALDAELVPKLVAATKGGSHAVLCLAPSVGAFKSAVGICRRGGTVVMVGLPHGELPLPIFDVVLRGITVRGSVVGASVLHSICARFLSYSISAPTNAIQPTKSTHPSTRHQVLARI